MCYKRQLHQQSQKWLIWTQVANEWVGIWTRFLVEFLLMHNKLERTSCKNIISLKH